MTSRLHVGTSGWVYPHWQGLFYPPTCGASSKARLAFYASRFSTVEVNATFYSLVTPTACDRWRSQVPEGFVFAIKGSRYITHLLRLQQAQKALANFFAQGLLRLGAQMGPILWQLPPTLAFDTARVAPFFDQLPRTMADAERLARKHDARLNGRATLTAPDRGGPLLHAVEPRHASWLGDDALQFLRARNVALVAADTAGVHPAALVPTADFVYLRLHGAERLYESRYTHAELSLWRDRITSWTTGERAAYVYFDNDNKANAPKDAERLRALLARRRPAAWSAAAPATVADRPDRFTADRRSTF